MSLPAGTRLGVYEVLGPLGSGGMGEVFAARDSRLERTVAIKILPPYVAADPTLKQRFEREARALAALSHPHICAVFDIGHAATEDGDIDFLVMEYLEGETLAQRLQKGALPVGEAIRYAIQIADALDKAHRKNVTHRDVKPGNIMLTPSGTKLLDFGLAKSSAAPPAAADLSASPTVTSPLTGAGWIVGTFQYMAPEQLEGHDVDGRADIFAFGAVLYEMLTGRRPFEGKSQASLIGAILEREPQPVSALQPTVPPALDQLVKTCLAKNPESRWQSAGDVARQLTWILEDSQSGTSSAARPVQPPPRRAWVVPAVAAAAVAIVGLLVWTMTPSTPSPAPEVSRLLLAPSANAPVVSVGGIDILISPDGKRIVYLGAGQQGERVFYVRELDSLDSRPIAGTELPGTFQVANPFLTADGNFVIFRSPGKGIMRVALSGGPPLKIAEDNPRFLGGTSAGNTVVLALGDGLYQTSATGGPIERLTQPDDEPAIYIAPSMVPGGMAVLFHKRTVRTQLDRITLLDLETRQQRVLVEDGIAPRYASSGHLVYARGTTLMAVPFDVGRLAVSGTPVAVQEGVQRPAPVAASDYSLSDSGTLIYVPANTAPTSSVTPVWVDRSGREIGPVVSTPLVQPSNIGLSSDGNRMLVEVGPAGDRDIWLHDLTGRPAIRLVERRNNVSPVWHPDGARIVFTSDRDGPYLFYSIPTDGSTLEPALLDIGGPPPVVQGTPARFPQTWLRDGRLVFVDGATSAMSGIFVVSAENGGNPEPLVQTEYAEDSARVSPDGRWLAYRSDRTGRSEIWVRAALEGAPARVSLNGGESPVWARNSRELFYWEGNKMMAVAIRAGSELAFDPAVQLFEHAYRRSYDVAPDGRFVVIPLAPEQSGPPIATGIVVVQNWTEELKRLVPVN